jgi:hypothetical protein
MNSMSRRSALVAGSAAAGSVVAVSAGTPAEAATSHGRSLVFTVRRTSSTLAANPPLGAPFIMGISLHDKAGNTQIGDGTITGMVVEVSSASPPDVVIQFTAVLRFAHGEIHLSSLSLRKVPEPGVKRPVAIIGGTGAYREARGEGTFEHATLELTNVVLNVTG